MAVNIRSASPKAAESQGSGYYTPENYAAEDSVGYLIGNLRSRVARSLDVEFGKLGFTAAQWPILRAVADGKTPIAADICRQFDYDTGSMTRMLNRLEEKGVIVREPSEDDRRIVRLRITPAGRRIYPKLCDAAIRMLNRMVAGFSVAEVRQLRDQLHRMQANLESIDD